ncbi:protein of unknown function [Paraburkholderia kururiensis]
MRHRHSYCRLSSRPRQAGRRARKMPRRFATRTGCASAPARRAAQPRSLFPCFVDSLFVGLVIHAQNLNASHLHLDFVRIVLEDYANRKRKCAACGGGMAGGPPGTAPSRDMAIAGQRGRFGRGLVDGQKTERGSVRGTATG